MTGPAIYQARARGQMRSANPPHGLEIHELRDDGEPVCGPKPDSHHKEGRMTLVKLDAGPVTCKSCAKITSH